MARPKRNPNPAVEAPERPVEPAKETPEVTAADNSRKGYKSRYELPDGTVVIDY